MRRTAVTFTSIRVVEVGEAEAALRDVMDRRGGTPASSSWRTLAARTSRWGFPFGPGRKNRHPWGRTPRAALPPPRSSKRRCRGRVPQPGPADASHWPRARARPVAKRPSPSRASQRAPRQPVATPGPRAVPAGSRRSGCRAATPAPRPPPRPPRAARPTARARLPHRAPAGAAAGAPRARDRPPRAGSSRPASRGRGRRPAPEAVNQVRDGGERLDLRCALHPEVMLAAAGGLH